jgi:hypothetical protein
MTVATRLTGAIVLGILAASIGVRVSTGAADPHAVLVSSDQAVTIARAFGVSGPFSTVELSPGSYHQEWELIGREATVIVDAFDGRVTMLGLSATSPQGRDVQVDAAAAEQIARRFLDRHVISVEGMTSTTELKDHGQTVDYRVTWTRRINGALVPVGRVVGVNPATGEIFSFSSYSDPFTPPPPPAISEADARTRAIAKVGTGATATGAELVVGTQPGTGRVFAWLVEIDHDGWHSLVQVDAMTGAASVIGVG